MTTLSALSGFPALKETTPRLLLATPLLELDKLDPAFMSSSSDDISLAVVCVCAFVIIRRRYEIRTAVWRNFASLATSNCRPLACFPHPRPASLVYPLSI
jgi:hypothetical protein